MANIDIEAPGADEAALAAALADLLNISAFGLTLLDDASAAAARATLAVGSTFIQEIVASSSASFDFTSIPSTWRHLKFIINGRAAKSATNDTINMTLNNDTGAHYDYNEVEWNGNPLTLGGQSNFNQTAAKIGYMVGATGPANAADTIEVDVFNYKGTTFHKQARALGSFKVGTSLGDLGNTFFTAYWTATPAAVTRATFTPAGGGWVDGTVASLYGWA